MFERGDVVELKSGGPKMTVVGPTMRAYRVNTEPTPVHGSVLCQWFEGKTRRSGDFDVETLKIAD